MGWHAFLARESLFGVCALAKSSICAMIDKVEYRWIFTVIHLGEELEEHGKKTDIRWLDGSCLV